MAVQDYELLLRVRADLLEAISGLKGLTTQLGQGDAAAKQLGESANAAGAKLDELTAKTDQATAAAKQLGATEETESARIDRLVVSLTAQDEALRQAHLRTIEAGTASRQLVQYATEEAAAYTGAKDASLAYREAEAVRSNAPAAAVAQAAAIAAQREEMSKLTAQIDPTVAALGRLDAQELSLQAKFKAGLIGEDDYQRFQQIINVNREAIAPADAAAVALEKQRVSMAKLAGQIDPTVSALAKLAVQEKTLAAMRDAGVIGLEDYTKFQAVIDKNRVSITKASQGMHEFSLQSSMARRELGRLGSDVANGNWGRFDQTALTLANYSGLMSLAFSATGLAIAGVVGSIGVFALAAVKGAADTDAFNKALAQSGNYAGETAGALQAMATTITRANGSVSDSRVVLDTLVASGKVGAKSLQALGQAAVDMAALTGMSADKAASAVLKLFDGTAAGAIKANEQYNFLTTGIYDQIKALEEQGNTEKAQELAAQAFSAAAEQRQRDLQAQLSETASWWDKIKAKAGGAWEAMKSDGDVAQAFGLANQQQKIDDLLKRKASAAPDASGHVSQWQGVVNNMLGLGFGKKEQAQLDALQAKQKADQQKAADQGTSQKLNSDAVTADAGLDRLASSIDKAYAKKEKIKELNKYFNDLWAGADPGNAKLSGVQRIVGDDGQSSFSGGLYDKLLENIDKAPKARKGRSQASIDASAATAQQQLVEMLGDVQGKLDPVAAAWAKYNKEVEKATKLAATAATGSHANVTAINDERDAYIAVAAKVREADLAEEADKDRKAYEKLRDSIKDVNGVSLATAFAQLKQLNDELARHTITQTEHDDTAKAVVDANIKPLPHYKGVDAVVGGPFGELAKVDDAQKQLDDGYAKQLDALNQFHEKKLISDQQFVDQENALHQAHGDEQANIDKGRQTVMLAGITQSLAAGADAMKQGFGAQSKEYRAAFALSKAAAIAQATVNMFTDISRAAAKGWPQNIPLIAMAAGEGLSILGSLRSISAGFSGGGYTGDGGKLEPAGVVHRKEFVSRSEVVAQPGALPFLEDFNKRGMDAVYDRVYGQGAGPARGYATGGYVDSPFASTAGFAVRREDSLPNLPDRPNAGSGSSARGIRVINVVDPSQVQDVMSSSEGEDIIMNHISRNASKVRHIVGK